MAYGNSGSAEEGRQKAYSQEESTELSNRRDVCPEGAKCCPTQYGLQVSIIRGKKKKYIVNRHV